MLHVFHVHNWISNFHLQTSFTCSLHLPLLSSFVFSQLDLFKVLEHAKIVSNVSTWELLFWLFLLIGISSSNICVVNSPTLYFLNCYFFDEVHMHHAMENHKSPFPQPYPWSLTLALSFIASFPFILHGT